MVDVNEKLARILDRTGDFRISRRVPTPIASTMSDADRVAAGLAVGVVLDSETTGLGPDDEVIELGMARVAFDPAFARIDHVISTFSGLRQPSRPIPPDVVRLTGISDRDVAGHVIDDDRVRAFLAGATVVVAHNAGFDRPVVERAWPIFKTLPWACSLTQIDWRGEGFEGRKLGQLLAERRLFHDGHRALDDVLALVHLLQLPLTLGATGFSLMLREAARITVRVWAAQAPFDKKDALKARGYRWSAGGCGLPRAWYRDIPEPAAEAEVEYLRAHIYDDSAAMPPLRRITALDRFSTRADAPATVAVSMERAAP